MFIGDSSTIERLDIILIVFQDTRGELDNAFIHALLEVAQRKIGVARYLSNDSKIYDGVLKHVADLFRCKLVVTDEILKGHDGLGEGFGCLFVLVAEQMLPTPL